MVALVARPAGHAERLAVRLDQLPHRHLLQGLELLGDPRRGRTPELVWPRQTQSLVVARGRSSARALGGLPGSSAVLEARPGGARGLEAPRAGVARRGLSLVVRGLGSLSSRL